MATDNATNPYHHFLRLVWKMRKAQKNAEKFKMRSQIANAESLEREVDKWLDQVGVDAAKVRQLSMISGLDSAIPAKDKNEP